MMALTKKDKKADDTTTTKAAAAAKEAAEEKVEAVQENIPEVPVDGATEVAPLYPKTPSVFINNPIMVEEAAEAAYGVFTSITSNNGTHEAGEEDLGKEIDFQAIVQKSTTKLIPGSNDEEAKDFFCTSKDGIYADRDGTLMADNLQACRAAGYSKCKLSEYIDIVCLIKACEKKEYVGEIMTLQLAPSSQFTWKPLAGKLKMQAAMGNLKAVPVNPDDPNMGSAVVFRSVATPTSFKGNKFTKFVFSIAKD